MTDAHTCRHSLTHAHTCALALIHMHTAHNNGALFGKLYEAGGIHADSFDGLLIAFGLCSTKLGTPVYPHAEFGHPPDPGEPVRWFLSQSATGTKRPRQVDATLFSLVLFHLLLPLLQFIPLILYSSSTALPIRVFFSLSQPRRSSPFPLPPQHSSLSYTYTRVHTHGRLMPSTLESCVNGHQGLL